MSILLSIDPGKQGAAVLLNSEGNVYKWWPAPLSGKEYDGRKLAIIVIESKEFGGRDLKTVIEKQVPRKINGKIAVFSTGFGYGRWLQALEMLDIPYREIFPAKWTAAFKPRVKLSEPERKAHYVRLARNLHPEGVEWDSIAKYQRSGIADALLMAEYSLRKEA